MNTKPTVSRYVQRDKTTVPPNTRAKADEEGDSYEFTAISRDHYACDSGKDTHVIIEKDGKIGCSCGDMTYRCTGTNVCKHIAFFLDLDVPPQIPASGELIKKLILMGWIGGKDNLHPAELLRNPQSKEQTEHYECPKCGEAVDIQPDKLRAWKLNHMDVCMGNRRPATTVSEMETNETTEKALAIASLTAAVDLIQGIDAGLTITAIRTRMVRVADDLMEAACEKL